VSPVIPGVALLVIGVFGVYGSLTGKLGQMLACLLCPQYIKDK
jgi:hypothetical protein